jgi:hypothetical protein
MIAPLKEKSSSPPACIVPNCLRPAKLRGVCASCYQNASKLIQRGGTTWEELERLGLVKPRHDGSGQRAALYVALAAAREKEGRGGRAIGGRTATASPTKAKGGAKGRVKS